MKKISGSIIALGLFLGLAACGAGGGEEIPSTTGISSQPATTSIVVEPVMLEVGESAKSMCPDAGPCEVNLTVTKAETSAECVRRDDPETEVIGEAGELFLKIEAEFDVIDAGAGLTSRSLEEPTVVLADGKRVAARVAAECADHGRAE